MRTAAIVLDDRLTRLEMNAQARVTQAVEQLVDTHRTTNAVRQAAGLTTRRRGFEFLGALVVERANARLSLGDD